MDSPKPREAVKTVEEAPKNRKARRKEEAEHRKYVKSLSAEERKILRELDLL